MRSLIAAFCLASGFAVLSAAHEPGEAHLQFEPPSVIMATQAAYPPHGIAAGTVILEVGVDVSGKIGDVRIVHDIPSLTESAQQSVHQWTFEPARLRRARKIKGDRGLYVYIAEPGSKGSTPLGQHYPTMHSQ